VYGLYLLGQSLGKGGEESIFLGIGRDRWRSDIDRLGGKSVLKRRGKKVLWGFRLGQLWRRLRVWLLLIGLW